MIGVGTPPPGEVRSGSTSRGRATERECWIALSVLPGIGPAGFARLLARHGSAAAAWRAKPEEICETARLSGPARARFEAMRARDPRDLARWLERATHRVEGRIVTGPDEAFPPALRTLDPPLDALRCPLQPAREVARVARPHRLEPCAGRLR